MEKNYKYDILTEHDLGVTIDLIDPSAYAQQAPHMSPGPNSLHPDDEKLLEDDTHTPQVSCIWTILNIFKDMLYIIKSKDYKYNYQMFLYEVFYFIFNHAKNKRLMVFIQQEIENIPIICWESFSRLVWVVSINYSGGLPIQVNHLFLISYSFISPLRSFPPSTFWIPLL